VLRRHSWERSLGVNRCAVYLNPAQPRKEEGLSAHATNGPVLYILHHCAPRRGCRRFVSAEVAALPPSPDSVGRSICHFPCRSAPLASCCALHPSRCRGWVRGYVHDERKTGCCAGRTADPRGAKIQQDSVRVDGACFPGWQHSSVGVPGAGVHTVSNVIVEPPRASWRPAETFSRS